MSERKEIFKEQMEGWGKAHAIAKKKSDELVKRITDPNEFNGFLFSIAKKNGVDASKDELLTIARGTSIPTPASDITKQIKILSRALYDLSLDALDVLSQVAEQSLERTFPLQVEIMKTCSEALKYEAKGGRKKNTEVLNLIRFCRWFFENDTGLKPDQSIPSEARHSKPSPKGAFVEFVYYVLEYNNCETTTLKNLARLVKLIEKAPTEGIPTGRAWVMKSAHKTP